MPWILEIVTGRQVLTGLGVFLVSGSVLFGVGLFPSLQALAPDGLLPEQQLGYPPDELLIFLSTIGVDGRSSYLLFQGLDLLTPVLFGWPAILGIAWLLKRGGSPKGTSAWLPLTPILFLIAEWSENFVLGNAVRVYPESLSMSMALPILTGSKFIALGLTFAVTVACGLRLVAQVRRR